MRIVSVKYLKLYMRKYAETKSSIESWVNEVKSSRRKSSHDIKQLYPSASILGKGRVVFNICGNHHRLIVRVNYKLGAVLVKWIGTHAEYDKIDVMNIDSFRS